MFLLGKRMFKGYINGEVLEFLEKGELKAEDFVIHCCFYKKKPP